ncbi:IS1182 family transposase [Paenibacillus sp. GP183]|uniref:IS1182 family transposase n=1 Tax=Paenibacillus sp. GP183 TaxID=1882751 RepID=UPI000896B001|nr:IS1182 family transposase [Paenibacillus sp. GP183]SEB61034.1 Transposase [Paenibacillus sp. GP183]
MMGVDKDKQNQFMYVSLDDLVPQDHLLRDIRNKLDFSFIYEKVQHLYSPMGCKSIDPVLLMKMLLIGYLFGIPSERKLEQEIIVNLAYRWFLGLDLAESVPDHSTLSQNRRRRFKNSQVFQDIFDHIVSECMTKEIVTGEVIVVDSTHIKAHASIGKTEKIVVEKKPTEYLKELEQEARRIESEWDNDPNKKKGGRKRKEEPSEKEVTQSKTDPEAGLLSRPNKPKGFHYLAHTSIDVKHGIITDIHVTPANINDHEPFTARLREQQHKFNLRIQKVGADKGYDRSPVHHTLEQLEIKGYIAPINSDDNHLHKSGFNYDSKSDTYTCPEGKILRFSHLKWKTERQSSSKIYASQRKDCKQCPLRSSCFGKTGGQKKIERPLFQEARERKVARTQTNVYRDVQKARRVWCEGSFGTMKRCHNLTFTYKKGIQSATEHCLLSALALNIKRYVKVV